MDLYHKSIKKSTFFAHCSSFFYIFAENNTMNTHKTYVAYDAVGVLDHENSNYKTFQQLQAWQKMRPRHFCFLNTDEINFSSEHDDLIDSTIKNRLLALMAKADNLLVLISPHTNTESPILNWQISKAVNRFRLPVVIAYVGKQQLDDNSVNENQAMLPNKIRKYIGRDSARMCHIPLTQDKLERALGTFSVGAQTYPWDSTTIF